MNEMKTATIDNLLDLAQMDLLVAGGVHDWEWYDESVKNLVRSEDYWEGIEDWLNAMLFGGVDNWEWHDEAMKDYDAYEEYLEELEDLTTALRVGEWQEQKAKAAASAYDARAETAFSEPSVEASATPVAEVRYPNGEAEKSLFEHIATKVGDEDALRLFNLAIEKGIWKRNSFPKEYDKALKAIVEGAVNPMELARDTLLKLVVKNGKLDTFLDALV